MIAMTDHEPRGATVLVGKEPFPVVPDEPFTFGRSRECTACLDPDDRGISRVAGSVEFVGVTLFVNNKSQVRPLAIVDPLGFRSVLAPTRRVAVDQRLSVVVEGQVRRHELVVATKALEIIEPAASDLDGLSAADGIATEMGGEVAYTAKDRLALVALFAGYLEGFPRHDPRPRSYADAAARLGWPRTTLMKRVEHLRTRLIAAGVPSLYGERALEALAEHVIATGVITREDLELLG